MPALLVFTNFILLALSDNDKPMLMRQKIKQGFVYKQRFTVSETHLEVALALQSAELRHCDAPSSVVEPLADKVLMKTA